MKKIATMLSLSLLAASACAQADGWYAVGEVTHSRNKLSTSTTDSALADAGAVGVSTGGTKGNHNQWRLQLGYQFNPNFAIEGGYIDLGKANYTTTYQGGSANGTVKAGGIDLAALGIVPLGDNFSIFGKAGVIAARVKDSLSATAPAASVSGSNTSNAFGALLGVGVTYKLNRATDLRAEFDHVGKIGKSGKTDKLSSDMVSLGLEYHF